MTSKDFTGWIEGSGHRCYSCGRELTDFEVGFYEFEGKHACRECFMWMEFHTPIWWKFMGGKWVKTRGKIKNFERVIFPNGFNEVEWWSRIDEARIKILEEVQK